MSGVEPFVRLAEMADREAIHLAHMRSIREVCSRDHGPEEIRGWGNRELGERWIGPIRDGLVWVVDDGTVRGVAAIRFPAETPTEAFITSLYLTPEVLGLGLGRRLMATMLDVARRRGVTVVALESTLTAHRFYQHLGFVDTGPADRRPINGAPVTGIPMRLDLAPT